MTQRDKSAKSIQSIENSKKRSLSPLLQSSISKGNITINKKESFTNMNGKLKTVSFIN